MWWARQHALPAHQLASFRISRALKASMARSERRRTRRQRACLTLQRALRRIMAAKRQRLVYLHGRRAAACIQRAYRRHTHQSRQRRARQQTAAVRIQRVFRGLMARRRVAVQRHGVARAAALPGSVGDKDGRVAAAAWRKKLQVSLLQYAHCVDLRQRVAEVWCQCGDLEVSVEQAFAALAESDASPHVAVMRLQDGAFRAAMARVCELVDVRAFLSAPIGAPPATEHLPFTLERVRLRAAMRTQEAEWQCQHRTRAAFAPVRSPGDGPQGKRGAA